MTRFEFLKAKLTQMQLAEYLAAFKDCEDCRGCECYDFCKHSCGYSCVDALYKYLSTDQPIGKE